MTAGIAALEGRRGEALASYRETWLGWREIGCDFDLALAELDAVQLLGVDEAELRTAADEARAILERLRARPFLERLAAAVERGGGAPVPAAAAGTAIEAASDDRETETSPA
jgi:hypothetical protein